MEPVADAAAPDVEIGVQYRIYTDQGFEKSGLDARNPLTQRPWTEEEAKAYVRAYNHNREDETGLPATRVVRRFVGPWQPLEGK